MAGDTVKWPILRDSATGTDILITKSPSSSMGGKTQESPSGWYIMTTSREPK